MKTFENLFLFFLLFLLNCCSNNSANTSLTTGSNDSIQKVVVKENKETKIESVDKHDVTKLTESKNEEDIPINDYLIEELRPIRTNYHEINSIKEWTAVDKRKLVRGNENGVAEYYYLNGALIKIIAYYPDNKEILEFYLLNEQLSFAVFKSVTTEENSDEIIIDKNYFQDSRLIHKIVSQDCGAPFADDYIKGEQNRILRIYNTIKSRLKS